MVQRGEAQGPEPSDGPGAGPDGELSGGGGHPDRARLLLARPGGAERALLTGVITAAGTAMNELGYTMILHVIRHQIPHDPAARQVPFAVCQTAEFEPAVTPRITFVSQFHDLATGTATAEPR